MREKDATRLTEMASKAIRELDAKLASRVAEILRFRYRMNYNETLEWLKKNTGASQRDWENALVGG